MKSPIFTFLFFCLYAISLSSQPYLEWDVRYNGPVGNDYGKLIAVDEDGNVYVAGVSDGLMKDVIIIKYNQEGDTLWTRLFNSPGNGDDEPYAIKIDNQGNVCVTGSSMGANSTFDILTLKYDSNGNLKWYKIINDSNSTDDIGNDLTIDVFNNIYVCGKTGIFGIIIKYNSDGTQLWLVKPYAVKYTKILFNHIGNIIVLGGGNTTSSAYYIVELNPLNGNTILLYNNGLYTEVPGLPNSIVLDKVGNMYVVSLKTGSGYDRIYTAKFSHGIDQASWSTYHSTGSNDVQVFPVDMKMDNDNNLYQLTKVYTNKYYYYFNKLDNSGVQQWAQIYQSNSAVDEYPVSLYLSNLMDPPWLFLAGYNSLGDIKAFKYDNEGELIWVETYDCGNNGQDITNNMFIDNCDNIYITGSSNCNNSYQDIKTIKYSTLEKPVIHTVDPPIVCLGNEISLSVDECSGCAYLWSTGQTTSSITVSPEETTDYYVTVTLPQNCPIVSEPVTIEVNPFITPLVTITESQNNICDGQNVIFTAIQVNGGENPSYNWMINDISQIIGPSNTYAANTLDHGDKITCLMTSNAMCLTNLTALSNEVEMIVNPILIASVQIAATNTEICSGQSVTFTASPVNGGPSPGYKWYVNDILQGETSSVFNASGLENGDVVKAEMISSEACVEPTAATSNSISITVNPLLTPEVNILASKNSICEGENITFTATAVNGGTNPVFNWYINNDLQEGQETTFSTTTLTNGSQVHCVMTSNETCLAQPSGTSNVLTIEVFNLVTPTVAISESQNNICDGQNVIFTATPVNGGENPTYNWMINDVSQIIGPSNTFADNTLEQGDNVSCLMTSNAICLTNPTALSNEVEMIVNPILTASVQIEATITEICSGQSVTFTASPVNGGASPGYKWYVNDILQVETSSVFNATGLENGAVVKAEMISSEACVEPGTATSNSISITVNPLLTPEVSILASKNSICEGENIAFTATVVNGGTNPVFNWYINNDLQEGHESTFSTTTLASGSQVHCVVTSNETCLAQPSGTSNVLTIEVFNLVTPTVVISESQNNICDGQNVIFTATPVNGGENPTYNWMLYDESQQSGESNTFAANTLEQGDKITCLMTSNAICLTNPTAHSNEVEMIVHPILTASIQIVATNTEICSGQSVTFTANPVNSGASPGYKWYVNNILQGEISSVFNATGLENGAMVKAEMISSEACVEPTTTTSNSISITVNPLLTPEVSILASKNSICDGENVTFSATAVNGGINPVFNWYINNDLQEGHESTFSTTTLASGSQVYCLMTSNEVCLAQAIATSNFVSVAVNPLLTPKVVINASSTAVFSCEQVTFTPTPTHGGLNPTYKWLVNGNIVSTVSTFVTSSLVNGAQVQCIMTSSANCVTTPTVSSEIITMTVFPLPQPELKLRLDTISVTNYSGSQYSYTWYFNETMISTQSTIICSTHGNGSYYVVVKLNNCTVTSNTIEFDCATFTEETEDNTKFIIYPNPTDAVIHIKGEQLMSGEYSIQLSNVLGEILEMKILNTMSMDSKTQLDLSQYPDGIYLIIISSDIFRKVYSVSKFK